MFRPKLRDGDGGNVHGSDESNGVGPAGLVHVVVSVASMEPDEEARKILTTAEELLVLGKIRESLEQAQIARDYYLESGGALKKCCVTMKIYGLGWFLLIFGEGGWKKKWMVVR